MNKQFVEANRPLLIISFLCLCFLFYMDLSFYKEKIYGDSASYLFQVVNFEKPAIEHGRPVSLFVEILPLIFVKFSASMKAILIAFSLNVWIYFFICTGILIFILKTPQLGLSLLLTLLIGSRINYFNPISELILSTPLVLIGFCMYCKEKFKLEQLIITFLIFLLVIYSHPLNSIVIPALFVIIFLTNKKMDRNRIILLILVSVMITIHYTSLDPYEKNPLAEVGNSHDGGFDLLLKFNYARFISKMFVLFTGAFVLFGISLYFIKKNYPSKVIISYILIVILGYLFLVLYKYGRFFSEANEPFERYLFPLSLIICFLYFSYGYRNNKWHHIILFFIVAYHSGLLINYGKTVKQRFSLLDKGIYYTQKLNSGKYAFRKENYYPKVIGHDWIISLESVLLTSIDGYEATRQFFIEDYFQKEVLDSLENFQFIRFPSPLWKEGISQLNPKYFKISEGPIILANTDGTQSDSPDSFFQSISLEFDGRTKLPFNKELLVPIIITNYNSTPLTSGLRKELVYISYHWLKEGKMIEWDGERTAILGDVYKQINQFINVKTPKIKGRYTLELGLVYEGKKWANIRSNQRNEIIIN